LKLSLSSKPTNATTATANSSSAHQTPNSAGSQTWKPRFFILHNGILRLFKDISESSFNVSENNHNYPMTYLPLKEFLIIDSSDKKNLEAFGIGSNVPEISVEESSNINNINNNINNNHNGVSYFVLRGLLEGANGAGATDGHDGGVSRTWILGCGNAKMGLKWMRAFQEAVEWNQNQMKKMVGGVPLLTPPSTPPQVHLNQIQALQMQQQQQQQQQQQMSRQFSNSKQHQHHQQQNQQNQSLRPPSVASSDEDEEANRPPRMMAVFPQHQQQQQQHQHQQTTATPHASVVNGVLMSRSSSNRSNYQSLQNQQYQQQYQQHHQQQAFVAQQHSHVFR
jgi:hypothetical protein